MGEVRAAEVGDGAGVVTYGEVGDVTDARVVAPEPARRGVSWMLVVGVVWMAGVGVCLARLVVARVRLGRVVRGAVEVREERAVRVLGECCAAMGVRRRVELRETGLVGGPALAGEWRGVLLVPVGLSAQLSEGELRCVFLHELAHLRRWDLGVDRVMEVVRAGHWFNPVVWWAVARYRGEREVARDSMVLRVLGVGERAGYGGTLVKVAAGWGGAMAAGAVGMTEPKRELRRRVRAVVSYRPGVRWGRAVVAGVVGVGIAVGLMTGRVEAKGDAGTGATTGPVTTSVVTIGGATTGPTGEEPALPRPTTRDAAAWEKLNRKIPLVRFENKTLREALDEIARATGVSIYTESSVTKAVTRAISARLRDVRASTALRKILDDAGDGGPGIDYVVADGVVEVGWAEGIQRRTVTTRTYDLSDLLSGWERSELAEGEASAVGGVKVTETAAAALAARGAQVVKLMTETIDPGSWAAEKWGRIHLVDTTLWVTQSAANHRLVAGVLAKLRETRALSIDLEARFVTMPAGALAKLSFVEAKKGAAMKDGAEGYFVDAAGAAELMAAAKGDAKSSVLTAPRLRINNGQRATLMIGQQVAYVAGAVTGADGKVAPKVGNVETGTAMDVSATVSADRHYVTMTYKAVVSRLREMRAGAAVAGVGRVQVPVTGNRKAEATTSVPDGGTLVVAMPGEYVLPAGEKVAADEESGKVAVVVLRPTILVNGERVGK